MKKKFIMFFETYNKTGFIWTDSKTVDSHNKSWSCSSSSCSKINPCRFKCQMYHGQLKLLLSAPQKITNSVNQFLFLSSKIQVAKPVLALQPLKKAALPKFVPGCILKFNSCQKIGLEQSLLNGDATFWGLTSMLNH